MNRAIVVRRDKPAQTDLIQLAMSCLQGETKSSAQPTALVLSFCAAYELIQNDPMFKNFFGLRDFYHFLKFYRRNQKRGSPAQVILWGEKVLCVLSYLYRRS